jgi:hypothetical protein
MCESLLVQIPFRELGFAVRVGGRPGHGLVHVLDVVNEFHISCYVLAARFQAFFCVVAGLLCARKSLPHASGDLGCDLFHKLIDGSRFQSFICQYDTWLDLGPGGFQPRVSFALAGTV